MFLLFFFFKDGLTFVLLCLFDRVSPASQVVFRCTHLSPPVSAFQVRGGGWKWGYRCKTPHQGMVFLKNSRTRISQNVFKQTTF